MSTSRSALAEAQGWVFRRQRRRVIAAAGLLGLLVATAHVFGAFSSWDAALQSRLASVRSPPPRPELPLLISLDAATLARWGPPPFAPARWQELAEALSWAGIGEAYLVDAPELVIAAAAAAADVPPPLPPLPLPPPLTTPGAARLFAPVVLSDPFEGNGVLRVSRLSKASGVVEPWDRQLYLPALDDGVVRDISRASRAADLYGASVFCAWSGRCPDGERMTLPIWGVRDRDTLPRLSAAELLERRARVDPSTMLGRVALIGLTAAPFARGVRAGPDADELPALEVVGLAVAAARTSLPARSLHALLEALLLLVVLAGGIALLRSPFSGAQQTWLFLFVIAVVVGALLLYVAGLLRLPLIGFALVGMVPWLTMSLWSRYIVSDFLDAVVRTIAQEAMRYSPRVGTIGSDQDLLVKLGGLTRNYFGQGRCFLMVPDGQCMKFFGGYGVTADDLHPSVSSVSSVSSAPWPELFATRDVGIGTGIVIKGDVEAAWLVPLYAEGLLRAVWGIPYPARGSPPAAFVLSELVRWLSPRLLLESAAKSRAGREIDGVRELVVAATDERRQTLETLQGLPFPLLVADVASSILLTSREMSALLLHSGIGAVTSLRDLIFKLQGESGTAETIHRLFELRETVVIPWEAPGGGVFHVMFSPVRGEGDRPGTIPLCYVASFQDVRLSVELKRQRALIANHISGKVRQRLMVLSAEASMLQGKDGAGERILAEVHSITGAIDEIEQITDTESKPDVPMPSSVVELIEQIHLQLKPVLVSLHVQIGMKAPAMPSLVMIAPGKAKAGMIRLLTEAARLTPAGESISVAVRDLKDRTILDVSWPGVGIDDSVSGAGLADGDPAASSSLPQPLLDALRSTGDAFGAARVTGSAGRGVVVTFELPRA